MRICRLPRPAALALAVPRNDRFSRHRELIHPHEIISTEVASLDYRCEASRTIQSKIHDHKTRVILLLYIWFGARLWRKGIVISRSLMKL
jgi:hypothetical protein